MLQLFDNKYPYTDFHELNLDWIISKIICLDAKLTNFVSLNTIKYADPIAWNITKQYETNTVVIDSNTGTAYISTQPVPAGVGLNNTNYWTPIFTLDIVSANKNITSRNDGGNPISTFPSVIGDWLLYAGDLYKVIMDIPINTAYVVGYNIQRYTVEDFVREYVTNLQSQIGDLDDLTTTDKDTVVDAINELDSEIGDLDDLTTTDKDTVVDAINELDSDIGDINELIAHNYDRIANVKDYGALGDDTADDTAAINLAIADIIADNKDILFFPPGTYKVTDELSNIGRSNIRICGLGAGISQIKVYDSLLTTLEANLFTIESSSIYHVEVDHISIIGNMDASTGFTAFKVDGTHNLNMHDIFFTGVRTFARFGGVGSSGGIWTVLRDIIGSTTRLFASVEGGYNGISLINCQINSERSYSGSTAIRVVDCTIDTLYCTDCLFQRFNYGMSLRADTGNVIQNFFVDNSIFDGTGYQALAMNVTGGDIARCFFNNCYINSTGSSAVSFGTGTSTGRISDIKISDCNFSECYESCIVVNSNVVHDLMIKGNDMTGYNKSDGGTYPGISILSGISEFMILDNVIGNTPSSPSYAKMGIKIYSGCSNFIVANNDVHDNTVEGINCESTPNAKSCFIYGNNGYNQSQNCSSITPPASGGSVTHLDPRSATYYINGNVTNVILNNTTIGAAKTIHMNPGDLFQIAYSGTITMAVQYD